MIRDTLLLLVFPAAMALAAATDLFTMTVPNRIALALVAGFVLLAPMIGMSWNDVGLHVAMGALGLALGFCLFAFGWVGGGDAKLFAATCLWLGPELVFTYAVFAALLGGVLTLGLLFLRAVPLPAPLVNQGWLVRLHDAKEGVPYGVALAAAGLIVYPQTPFIAAFGG
jgi:prepilin peptidase CpaA